MSGLSGRRRPWPVRRLAGAGLAGVAATFAVAPLAMASANAGTASAPADASAGQHPDGTSNTVPRPRATIAPNYGFQKIRVGVQIKDGAYVPPGTTTAGTETTITETGPNAPDPGASTCDTDGSTQEPGSTATYCIFPLPNNRRGAAVADDIPTDQFYTAEPADTVTVTQTTVNANLLIDSSTMTFGPCTLTPDDEDSTCSADQTALFNDPGIPPVTQNDSGTLKSGGTIVIDVTANDNSYGAPSTIAVDTPPADGTATPTPATSGAAANARDTAGVATTSIRYTPNAGFSGNDKFTYTLTDANGSSTATVFLTVTAPPATPPAAVNDTAATVSGRPVTIHVLGNDEPNGGGPLHLTSVGKPSHGTAKIDGTTIVYRPADGFTGVDHFMYTTANSGGQASARVTVTVTAPPVSPPQPPPSTASTLPMTGAPIAAMVASALVLITGGSLFAAIGRRQRRGHSARC